MTLCPISAARGTGKRYPGEVAIPEGEAGQTKDALIQCYHVRTISTSRIVGSRGEGPQYVTDPKIRMQVREALAHHLGLDIPPSVDGAE